MNARQAVARIAGALLLLLSLVCTTAYAEERTITGTVDQVGEKRLTVITQNEAISIVITTKTKGGSEVFKVGERVTVIYVAADVNVATEIKRVTGPQS